MVPFNILYHRVVLPRFNIGKITKIFECTKFLTKKNGPTISVSPFPFIALLQLFLIKC